MKSKLDLFKRVGFFDEREVIIGHLRDFFSIVDKHQVQACIMFGTLLGKLRHDDFIPWDDDVDVVIFTFDLFLERCAAELEQLGYIVELDIRGGRRMGCRVFHESNQKIPGRETPRFPWIGIWEHEMVDDDLLTLPPEEIRYAVDDFLPLKHVEFLGFRVAVPNRPESVLDTYFGSADWIDHCVLPERDHRNGGVLTHFPKDKFKLSEVLDYLSKAE